MIIDVVDTVISVLELEGKTRRELSSNRTTENKRMSCWISIFVAMFSSNPIHLVFAVYLKLFDRVYTSMCVCAEAYDEKILIRMILRPVMSIFNILLGEKFFYD